MARRESRSRFALVPLVTLLAGPVLLTGAPPAAARTFVIPHVLEASGTTAGTPFTFDTTIFADYTPGQAGSPAGGGATVDLHLFDNTGQPMRNNGAVVCAPCSFPLDSNVRKQSIRIDDLIVAHGAFDAGVKLGFGVIVVGGADADRVALQGFVVNSHTSGFDLETLAWGPQVLGHLCDDTVPTGEFRRTYSFPHVLETTGRITNTTYTFDTTIFATYTGALAGIPPGPTGSANVLLYLFDEEGNAMTSLGGQDVCAPCTYPIGVGSRKVAISIEQEFLARGGMPGPVTGYAIAVVEGEPDNVNLQALVLNSHTNAFDLAMTGLDPRSIPENAGVGVPEAGPALDGALRVTPNPARAGAALGFDLAREMDVELAIYDAGGRKVAEVWNGRRGAGPQSLAWDGRLADGTLAPAGVYFARLAGEGVVLQNRVVALR